MKTPFYQLNSAKIGEKSMKNLTILAKTPEKESYSIEDCTWYKEFAIAQIDKEEERDDLVNKYGCREIWAYSVPCVTLRRRVDIINGEILPRDWDILDFGNGVYETASKHGDGDFYSAISLDPMHSQIVTRAATIRTLNKELQELKNRITPCKFMRVSLLADEYQNKLNSELKSRKLYRKAQNNEVNPNVLNSIKKPILEEYKQELNRINTRIEEIENELKELNN
jgi:hypothetical protein